MSEASYVFVVCLCRSYVPRCWRTNHNFVWSTACRSCRDCTVIHSCQRHFDAAISCAAELGASAPRRAPARQRPAPRDELHACADACPCAMQCKSVECHTAFHRSQRALTQHSPAGTRCSSQAGAAAGASRHSAALGCRGERARAAGLAVRRARRVQASPPPRLSPLHSSQRCRSAPQAARGGPPSEHMPPFA